MTVCSPGATIERIFRRVLTAGSAESRQSKDVSAPPSNLDCYDAPVSIQRGAEIEIVRAGAGVSHRHRRSLPWTCVSRTLPKRSRFRRPTGPEYLHQESFSSMRTDPGPATLRSFTSSGPVNVQFVKEASHSVSSNVLSIRQRRGEGQPHLANTSANPRRQSPM